MSGFSNPQNWRPLAEEALAALYIIGAIQAWQAGYDFLGWALAAKAAIDTAGAVITWLALRKESQP